MYYVFGDYVLGIPASIERCCITIYGWMVRSNIGPIRFSFLFFFAARRDGLGLRWARGRARRRMDLRRRARTLGSAGAAEGAIT